MLKIGVLGAGHIGKIHLKCIKNIPEYELVGFYDINDDVARSVEKEFGIKSFNTIEDLVSKVDVVDIVTPTIKHFECASVALRQNKHVFLEKPIVATPLEARHLAEIADEANVKVQVGHVERFNPAFLAVEDKIKDPMFLEVHRLSQYNSRGTDVPVIFDLMIHDLDILLHLVKSKVKHISASGVPIISSTADIANTRIEFENGAVANLTASRMSMKKMRKCRIFQKNAYITVDFLEKKSKIISISDEIDENNPFAMCLESNDGKIKQLSFEEPEVHDINAIQTELQSFYDAIVNNVEPVVSMNDGIAALELAHQINELVMKYLKIFTDLK
ncbi:MAG: Gfo/Idh/MocA family oxidoreductase [Bacteroidales bacterium]|jgi:predicted dehydrogenase|nr:Gfo/Idh/MocA family oxidoreductase [Bacteroidales bacterium]MDD2204113.1 Gfo/Idh/MocA family oxidoreductase [Bacteroidales bacterium]MDD3152589.1 Gfo/Idh/MocA family oxidoreductase [Bacteroidales bacterium]MDD3913777.1 Gfo/Idh/MocA family oxidoreductase [Bacteroidales bacterium]MDD4633542.1 Gfo/Idh/MocA family oxidoreductase [Bacteroidales bacterium]